MILLCNGLTHYAWTAYGRAHCVRTAPASGGVQFVRLRLGRHVLWCRPPYYLVAVLCASDPQVALPFDPRPHVPRVRHLAVLEHRAVLQADVPVKVDVVELTPARPTTNRVVKSYDTLLHRLYAHTGCRRGGGGADPDHLAVYLVENNVSTGAARLASVLADCEHNVNVMQWLTGNLSLRLRAEERDVGLGHLVHKPRVVVGLPGARFRHGALLDAGDSLARSNFEQRATGPRLLYPR